MRADSEAEAAADSCCANCGIKEIDDIKLKKCAACNSVRYCGRTCQKDHRPKHKRACKQRAAELRDELLFRQNKSSLWEDCPICCLPMPLGGKYSIASCCGKIICYGCAHADQMRATKDEPRCPFCRKIIPESKTDKEIRINYEKRAAANDPIALRQIGLMNHDDGDYDSALDYWKRAAALGDAVAHCNLAFMYMEGEGIEKDEKMYLYHAEEAAIAGHPLARYLLGCHEGNNKRFDRAVKHFIIAANLGHNDSLQVLKELYKDGIVSKDDLAAALRAHQAAVDAMKSSQREEAEDFYRKLGR